MSDDYLIERFGEYAIEHTAWTDPDGVWQFTIATVIGELSGHVFPLTQEERAYWEAQERAAREEAQQQARRETEPLGPVPVVAHTV